MDIIKLKGSTYFIKSPTNIGVYSFKNKECVVIDTGIGNSHARKIDKVLEEKGLRPKYIINTHAHLDHIGGNTYFQEKYTGVQIYANEQTKVFIENKDYGVSVLYGARPLKKLEEKRKDSNVDFTLSEGINKIGDDKFEIIELNGHCSGHIGILTHDKVCFIGDSIFSKGILEKYSFPYLFDIERSIETLNKIKEIEAETFVISHSDKVYSKDEIIELVDYNISNIFEYVEQFREILSQPMTIEDLVQNISVLNDLELNFKQYHLNQSTTKAFVSYLYNNGELEYTIDEGKMYYYLAS